MANKYLTNPKKICSLFVFISLISLILISNLKINTSTDSLINENLDFKKNQNKLKDSFKVLNNNILIRIKGENYDEVKLADFGTSKQTKNTMTNTSVKGTGYYMSPELLEI